MSVAAQQSDSFNWEKCPVGAWKNKSTMQNFAALDGKQVELVQVGEGSQGLVGGACEEVPR